ncbi:ribonuclease P protein component [Candidatus Parcubacteria bacterium]|nr:ribonuclease P protein component [Candidatus Parcubacteria bacterium]
MLPKENRLRSKKDFDRVFREGRGLKEDFLYLKFAKNNSNFSRFGFIVSQKVSKRAVVRNRLKRALRALIRTRMPRVKKGVDIVLIAISGLENKDFWELENIVDKIFERTKILENINENISS